MSTRRLAIHGGDPEFSVPLHVGRPNIPDHERFLQRVREILESGWLTNDGPCVREFEERIAQLAGTRFCVAMSNGTVALEIAARALGLMEEVIVPAFTFIATAHALMWQGIRPVFCDIDPVTHHIDPSKVEALINHRTSGILAVHLWGRACDTTRLTEIAARHGLPLLFDACHALGVEHEDVPVGGFGRCEIFSFHATKYLNTLEGGAVVTDDEQLAEKMQYMRNFGFCGEDCVAHLGTNGKMNEVSAAMGLVLVEDVDALVASNEAVFRAYESALSDVPGLTLLPYPASGRFNFQHVVVMVDERRAGLGRDDLVALLRAENVLARRYFYPGCHRMKPYSAMHEYAGLRLPVTDDVAARVVVLPTGAQVGIEGAERVGELMRRAVTVGAASA
jgi:dTDP-4-amino-4,6-dideoxygalactose transaminase